MLTQYVGYGQLQYRAYTNYFAFVYIHVHQNGLTDFNLNSHLWCAWCDNEEQSEFEQFTDVH